MSAHDRDGIQLYRKFISCLTFIKEIEENMTNTFFICPHCGNNSEFIVITSHFRVIRQSPEVGIRTDESESLPNLRKEDNYIECQKCSQRFEYDSAVAIGKRYLQTTRRLQKYPQHLSSTF